MVQNLSDSLELLSIIDCKFGKEDDAVYRNDLIPTMISSCGKLRKVRLGGNNLATDEIIVLLSKGLPSNLEILCLDYSEFVNPGTLFRFIESPPLGIKLRYLFSLPMFGDEDERPSV